MSDSLKDTKIIGFRVKKEYEQKLLSVLTMCDCSQGKWLENMIDKELSAYNNRKNLLNSMIEFTQCLDFLKGYTVFDPDKKRGKKVLNSIKGLESELKEIIQKFC